MENDWVNLQTPELSRVLRRPMAKEPNGLGLGLCRDRKIDPAQRRLRLLWKGYAHAIQPLDKFPRVPIAPADTRGEPVVSSPPRPIRTTGRCWPRSARRSGGAGRAAGDMPGADMLCSACRQFNPPPLPAVAPPLAAEPLHDGSIRLAWEHSARTIGLTAELHRGPAANFTPSDKTLLAETVRFEYTDTTAPAGQVCYALVLKRPHGSPLSPLSLATEGSGAGGEGLCGPESKKQSISSVNHTLPAGEAAGCPRTPAAAIAADRSHPSYTVVTAPEPVPPRARTGVQAVGASSIGPPCNGSRPTTLRSAITFIAARRVLERPVEK